MGSVSSAFQRHFTAIHGDQWQSTAINGNQRQSNSINDNLWQSMAINGTTAINGNHLQTHVLRQQHGLKRTFAILDTRPDTILEARGHLHAMREAITGHQQQS